MVRFTTLLLLFIFMMPRYILSQQTAPDIASVFDGRGEVYFRFENNNRLNPGLLTKIISIDHKTSSDWIYAYANKEQFEKFLGLDISFELLPHPSTLYQPATKSKVNIKEPGDWDYYPTYEAYIDMMHQFEELYPELCDVFSIGTSIQGRQLMFAKISAGVNAQEPEPRFLYTSSIHGDEVTAYILMLRLIDYLLKNYGSDDQVTNLLDNMEIWINPLANPDGTYAGGNNSVFGATRFNANNIDLNRNFPDPEDGQHPDGHPWQKETIEFMELADSVAFVMAANFHGGAEVFNYPWDTWAQLHADDEWWQYVGREWADTVHQYAPDGYFTFMNNGITNGYAWYTISGGRQDYMMYFRNCREVTLEISDIKILPEDQLPAYWEFNYRSFLNYLEQGLYGVSGIITDSQTGLPVVATITINNHDADGSWVKSDSLTGFYCRPVFEGTYSITYSAPKYQSQTIEQVVISNQQQIKHDVALVYTGQGIGDNWFFENFKVGPNPVKESLYIHYSGAESLAVSVELIEITGRSVMLEQFEFSPAKRMLNIDTENLTHGIYFISIMTETFEWTGKIVVR